MNKPKARQENVVVQKLENETLVYDLNENKALCLNETSALVWELCDGTRTALEIAGEVSKKLKSLISEEFVYLALDQLSKEALLENESPNYFGGLSRREVIRKVGFATIVALPVVSSVVAPNAAAAQSGGLPLLSSCTVDGECASGNCTSTTAPTPALCCNPGAAQSFPVGHLFHTLTTNTCGPSGSACCSASIMDNGIVSNPPFPGGLARQCECLPF